MYYRTDARAVADWLLARALVRLPPWHLSVLVARAEQERGSDNNFLGAALRAAQEAGV